MKFFLKFPKNPLTLLLTDVSIHERPERAAKLRAISSAGRAPDS